MNFIVIRIDQNVFVSERGFLATIMDDNKIAHVILQSIKAHLR